MHSRRMIVSLLLVASGGFCGCSRDPVKPAARIEAPRRAVVRDAPPPKPTPGVSGALAAVRAFVAAVRDGDRRRLLEVADMKAIAAAQRPPGIAPSPGKTSEVVDQVLARLMDPESPSTVEIAGSRAVKARADGKNVRVTVFNGKVYGAVLVRKSGKRWRIVKINP